MRQVSLCPGETKRIYAVVRVFVLYCNVLLLLVFQKPIPNFDEIWEGPVLVGGYRCRILVKSLCCRGARRELCSQLTYLPRIALTETSRDVR